ncbi:HD domain-containing protein [Hungatella hathewayi]|uniref:HD domain-containing protein n=1 Tax=Hungatella hathewayi TaxID=154046 RepID=UPI0026DDC73D|nr:HD domain-containing protein [Hungatella hathewayi]
MENQQMGEERLDQYLNFIKETELLKNVLRTAWGSTGRQESTAEHSWRLALFAALLLGDYPELDGKRVLFMCLIHDLGELYDGDISAALLPDEQQKHAGEQRSVERLFSFLPEKEREYFMAVWREYNENSTPEAHLVKALDKAETILQHNQGINPPDFDYEFNLQYGASYFKEDGRMAALRARLDLETKKHIM